jgi:hypothetical protein
VSTNPGPGTYAVEKVTSRNENKLTNSFCASEKKIGPITPGSTLFQESSYMQNPNPLTYCKSIIEFGKAD